MITSEQVVKFCHKFLKPINALAGPHYPRAGGSVPASVDGLIPDQLASTGAKPYQTETPIRILIVNLVRSVGQFLKINNLKVFFQFQQHGRCYAGFLSSLNVESISTLPVKGEESLETSTRR